MIQFHETLMGKRFYEGTMPTLAESVESLLKSVQSSEGIKVKGLEEMTEAINRLTSTLESFREQTGGTSDSSEKSDYPLSVEIPHGRLCAKATGATDEYPGIEIGFIPNGQTFEENVCLVEVNAAEDEIQDGSIIVHVWKAGKEDPVISQESLTAANMKKSNVAFCPKCGKAYTDYPALSREDGETKICPDCGVREALEAAGYDEDEQEDVLEQIHAYNGEHEKQSSNEPDPDFTPEEQEKYDRCLEAVKKEGQFLKNLEEKFQTKELCLEAVKQDGYALQYVVKEQTSEICLAAVRENGFALQFVREQTPEICLAAVEQNGFALADVVEQIPDICLAAVKQNGLALKYVKERTLEICLAAVKEDGDALSFVKEQTPEICLAAVEQNGLAIVYVKEQTPEICLSAVRRNGLALEYIPEQLRTPEICLAAVKDNGWALEFVRNQTPEICLAAVFN